MASWAAALLVAAGVCMTPRPAAATTYERPSVPNAILGISTACSADSMNVTVRMRQPFRGIVYSRGFPLECSTARDQHHKLFDFLRQRELRERERRRERADDGELSDQDDRDDRDDQPLQPSREVTLSLPAAECGIRVVPSKDGEGLWLQTSVVVQLDRHLQQAADQTRTASCYLPSRESSSSVLLQPLQQQRTGRQHGDEIPSVDFGEASPSTSSPSASPSSSSSTPSGPQHLQRARAVMEILSTAGRGAGRGSAGRDPGVLAVGEEAALIVTSHLPAGVGSRVTDCFAHDGAGEGMERLSDGRGCPTDRLILPQLRELPAQGAERRRRKRSLGGGLTTHVTAAKFAAFKFPDRSRLHLRCQLQLCRGACPQDSCLPDKANVTRQERRARKGERGEVLGRLQVFNSVEVLAPGIEVDDRLRLDELTAASGGSASPVGHAAGEKTFCLSPPKMALALATLGSILLCAVAVALYTLLRGHSAPPRPSRSPPAGAPLSAFLRRHFLRLRAFQTLECGGSHGSSASLGERNVLVHVQDGTPSPRPSPTPGTVPGQGGHLWRDKMFR